MSEHHKHHEHHEHHNHRAHGAENEEVVKVSFDEKAATWDSNPFIIEWTAKVTEEIGKLGLVKENEDCLEFGCGTGLLTVNIAKHAKSVTGVDSSQGMIDQFNLKAATCEKQNMKGVCLFLSEYGQLPLPSYHFIYSNLTMHHISQPLDIFKLFYSYLAPLGHVCIIDFQHQHNSEKFHPKDACGVEHHGFRPGDLSRWLSEAGFEVISETSPFSITKPVEHDDPSSFRCLFAIARKPAPPPS